MSTITKERLLKIQQWSETYGPVSNVMLPAEEAEELARIALASLEAEPVGCDACGGNGSVDIDHGEMGIEHIECPKCYTAPPAPVSVPDDVQCKPHPVMAVKGELGFLDHFERIISERDDDIDIGQLGHGNYEALMIAALDAFRAAMLQGADGNSPVIPDGWVACSELMPDIGTEIFYFCQDDGLRGCGIVSSSNFSGRGDAQLYVHAEGYDLRFGVDITHWMPLPNPPQE